MKASDLLSAIEEASLRPLLVEVALRERKLLQEHEQRHQQAFEDGLVNFNLDFNRSSRCYDQHSEDGCDGFAPDGGEGGEGPDVGERNAVRRDDGPVIKTTVAPMAPSNLGEPTATTTSSGSGERCSGTSQGQRRADSSRTGAPSPKRATTTTKQREESRSDHTGRRERDGPHHRRKGAKKEASLKDETWEQVRHVTRHSAPCRASWSTCIRLVDYLWRMARFGLPRPFDCILTCPVFSFCHVGPKSFDALQLLARAASIAALSLTESEHSEMLRLASILLLGFLLPHSTGNPAKLLRHALRRKAPVHRGFEPGDVHRTAKFDPTRYVLDMTLEERMEQSVQVWESNEHGELGSDDEIHDEALDAAFHGFVSNGLKPLLEARPLPVADCDLVTVIAMAIHPMPQPELNPITNRMLNQGNSAIWKRTKALMSAPHACQFQIHYENRRAMVRLVREALRLPALPEISDSPTHCLLHGPVPHLRAALRAFGRGTARSADDVLCAHAALVNIAIDANHPRILDEEWTYQLHTLAEDRSGRMLLRDEPDCFALGHGPVTLSASAPPVPLCLYTARGVLLSEFLARLSRSSSTAASKERLAFLSRAARSLSDAIEWQVDCWIQPSDDTENPRNSEDDAPPIVVPEHPAELLAALVSIAASLLMYLPLPESGEKNDGDDDEEEEPFTTLSDTCTHLLCHSNLSVAQAASEVVKRSLSRRIQDRQALLLFKVLQNFVERSLIVVPVPETRFLDPVVAIACHGSPAFAHALVRYLLKTLGEPIKEEMHRDVLCRFLSVASANNPLAVNKTKDDILTLLSNPSIAGRSKLQLISCTLSLRHARFFGDESQAAEALLVRESLHGCTSATHWDAYRLACHAMRTGNFATAADSYHSLLLLPTLSEQQYMWTAALESVAAAESMLVKDGATGIPPATVQLRSSLSHLHSFERMADEGANISVAFQRRYLLLRLEFLDLATVFRQLTMEMRLTGSGPNKRTRPFVHVQNVAKAFLALSGRYVKLNQRHGLAFQSAQSSSALRLLEIACLFMSQAVLSCFADTLPPSMNRVVFTPSLLDSTERHPLAMLMRRLHELVLVPMGTTQMDRLLRAAATLELIDGVLLVPSPFCSDFTLPTPKCVTCHLRLAQDPDEHREFTNDPGLLADDDRPPPPVIESAPSLCFTVICSGHVTTRDCHLRDPVWEVLVRYRITHRGPLEESDDNGGGGTGGIVDDTKSDGAPADASIPNPVTFFSEVRITDPVVIPLSSQGRFYASLLCPPIADEGLFALEVEVTCRDSSGREWDVHLDEGSRPQISIRTCRSR
jgi:hypothetical protein